MTKTELETKLSNIENIPALAAEIDAAADDATVLEILRRHNVELTTEDIRALIDDEDELDEDALDDVAGGCKCKGILKRAFNNILYWIGNKATGIKFTCPDCGH